jgi:hypothetical protein
VYTRNSSVRRKEHHRGIADPAAYGVLRDSDTATVDIPSLRPLSLRLALEAEVGGRKMRRGGVEERSCDLLDDEARNAKKTTCRPREAAGNQEQSAQRRKGKREGLKP